MVSERQRPVGVHDVTVLPNKGEHRVERLQSLLDLRLLEASRCCDHRRVEPVTLHAGRHQEPTVVSAQLPELALDHAPHRLRQVTVDPSRRGRHDPALLVLSDHPPITQIAHEVDHEEGVALGLAMHHRPQVVGKPVAGKLRGQVGVGVVSTQEVQKQFAADAASLQVVLDRNERALGDQQVRGPISDDDQHADRRQSATDERQHVDGRHVGPMQVFEHEHERFLVRQLFEKRAQLALHTLLRRRPERGDDRRV